MTQSVIIAGDSSAGLVTQGGNDGTLIIQSGAAGSKVNAISISAAGNITVPTNAAPTFSAYQSSAQTISNDVWTKIQLQTKDWDTATAFDATTNYRFTPHVAGYYNITGALQLGAPGYIAVSIYKNGAMEREGLEQSSSIQGIVSAIIFLNGTTDYVELYGYTSGSTLPLNANRAKTYFQGFLARSA